MDYIRMVFDRLLTAGAPSPVQREEIYEACRAEVAAAYPDPVQREKALSALEKAIRRQETQARYEDTLNAP